MTMDDWMRDSDEDEPQRPITTEILLISTLSTVIQLYTTATENTGNTGQTTMKLAVDVLQIMIP